MTALQIVRRQRHKNEGVRRCLEPGCNQSASYRATICGYPVEKGGTLCGFHRNRWLADWAKARDGWPQDEVRHAA